MPGSISVIKNVAKTAVLTTLPGVLAVGVLCGLLCYPSTAAAPSKAPTVTIPKKTELTVIKGGGNSHQDDDTLTFKVPIPDFNPLDKDNKDKNIVYRALTPANANSLAEGDGINSNYQGNDGWSLLEHVLNIGVTSGLSKDYDPWIATSRDLSVAKARDSGYGVVAIDLYKVSANKAMPMYEFSGYTDPDRELAQAYGESEQEVSVYHNIEFRVIVGFVK